MHKLQHLSHVMYIPLKSLNCLRNRLWILLHQIRSDTEDALFKENGPVDGVHVEEEQLLVLVIKFVPQILNFHFGEIEKKTCFFIFSHLLFQGVL